ncbi:MAG: hypothetical protein KBD01_17540 [Acidobacteria bacterium]|nr:hypothetical protein [Acidobacteriota bacterium]
MKRALPLLAPLVAALGFVAAPAQQPVEPSADATVDATAVQPGPARGCACHDALGPRNKAPVVDLQGWIASGVHRDQGCAACHPGSERQPHPAGMKRVDCAACHAEQAAGWDETVHGRVRDNDQVRGCQTCHMEHDFFRYEDFHGRYLGSGLRLSCAACHQPRIVSPLLKLPLKPAPEGQPWPASQHGFMAVGDNRFVTACQSCHGAHGIYPPGDARSRVAPASIVATCSQCHEGVTPAQVAGRICYDRGTGRGLFRNYFDVWYLWGGGIAAFSVLGLALALAAQRVVTRRARHQQRHPNMGR